MSIKSEQLLETVLDLERSRQRECHLRIESEALLLGLRSITDSEDRGCLFRALVDVLKSVFDFEEAFILQERESGDLLALVSTSERFRGSAWRPHSFFKRVFGGRPAAVFDVDLVGEWAEQPEAVRENVKSALHIGLHGGNRAAILVVTHRNPRHFGPANVRQATRFAPIAAQALATLGLQEAVLQRDRFFRLSLDLMGIVNAQGHLQQFNAAWPRVLGYGEEELKNRSRFLDYIHPADRDQLTEALLKLRHTGEASLVESRLLSRDGDVRWFSCSLAAYAGEQLIYIVARDITDRVMAEQQLAFQASHDWLTGLYNRAVFMDHLGRAMAQKERRPQYQYAVMYLDLDGFKRVNDTMGHNAGDQLLKEVSNRLLMVVRRIDTVARLGGDEFVILLHNLDRPDNARQVAERLQARLTAPVVLRGSEVTISGSIGIVMGLPEYRESEEVLRDADIAMYEAKARGKSQYVVFLPEMRGK